MTRLTEFSEHMSPPIHVHGVATGRVDAGDSVDLDMQLGGVPRPRLGNHLLEVSLLPLGRQDVSPEPVPRAPSVTGLGQGREQGVCADEGEFDLLPLSEVPR